MLWVAPVSHSFSAWLAVLTHLLRLRFQVDFCLSLLGFGLPIINENLRQTFLVVLCSCSGTASKVAKVDGEMDEAQMQQAQYNAMLALNALQTNTTATAQAQGYTAAAAYPPTTPQWPTMPGYAAPTAATATAAVAAASAGAQVSVHLGIHVWNSAVISKLPC